MKASHSLKWRSHLKNCRFFFFFFSSSSSDSISNSLCFWSARIAIISVVIRNYDSITFSLMKVNLLKNLCILLKCVFSTFLPKYTLSLLLFFSSSDVFCEEIKCHVLNVLKKFYIKDSILYFLHFFFFFVFVENVSSFVLNVFKKKLH